MLRRSSYHGMHSHMNPRPWVGYRQQMRQEAMLGRHMHEPVSLGWLVGCTRRASTQHTSLARLPAQRGCPRTAGTAPAALPGAQEIQEVAFTCFLGMVAYFNSYLTDGIEVHRL